MSTPLANPCRCPPGAIAISKPARIFAALLLSLTPALAAEPEGAPPVVSSPDAPVFVNLQPIVLPVIERDAVTRQVGILLTLELGDGHSSQEFEPKRRQLVDAFMRELYRLYDARSGADRIVDERVLKAHLLRMANAILGAGFVRAILIRQLTVQTR